MYIQLLYYYPVGTDKSIAKQKFLDIVKKVLSSVFLLLADCFKYIRLCITWYIYLKVADPVEDPILGSCLILKINWNSFMQFIKIRFFVR